MKSFDYIYDYYPESISEVTDEQKRIREKVQAFMSGDADSELIKEIVLRVKDAVATNQIDVVCFAPGTTGAKTILRYGALAEVLDKEVDSDVFLDAITLKFDADPITHTRFYQCNAKRIKGKIVLLIGGVYTTGQSLQEVSDLLKKNGAQSVFGLFIAKTILTNCHNLL